MGFRSDGFHFYGRGYVDAEVGRAWLTPALVTDVLLAPFVAGGYLDRITWMSRNLGTPEPIVSADELRARAASWGFEVVALGCGPREDPELEIFFGLDSDGPRFLVGVGRALAGPTLRDDVAGWARAFCTGWPAAGICFAIGNFAPTHKRFPRPSPPRSSNLWQLGLLDQYVGRTWHQATADRAIALDRFEHAELAAGARRFVDGDLLRIAFDASLDDEGGVAAARAAHERWLASLVPTKPEAGWNERGDRGVAPSRPTVRPPFTLYDEFEQVGYRALAVFPPDGALDEEAWAELAAIARAGALPDGTPVRAVRIILPRREDALAVHARAMTSGFEMATYPDGKAFWEVDPSRSPTVEGG
jgi:hypothetical protein